MAVTPNILKNSLIATSYYACRLSYELSGHSYPSYLSWFSLLSLHWQGMVGDSSTTFYLLGKSETDQIP